jgi:ribosome-binding ATPase YchF (GTP1/OBG family)
MQIAIIGLPASGKTTVFNTLTRGHADTGGYGGMTLHVGVVKVPDERLDRLAEIFKPKKIVHADVTYVDLPAPPASSEGHVGAEELPASGRHGTPAEREANEREEVILRRLKVELEAGRPIRDAGLAVEEARAIRGFRFLTEKPVLVLLNVGEGDIPASEALVERVAGAYRHQHALVAALSAKIEMELGELEPDEAAVFMTELGIAESGLARVIRLSYALLGLISFLTAGPDEVRAWPIPDGSTAVDAAGAIHTDLAKGFIRAEVVPYEDLLALGSTAEARRHGRLRSEGRTYLVHDGDVVEILFSR